MVDVNERIRRYNESKSIARSLRAEVEYLENLKQGLEEMIADENRKSSYLSNLVIASIKVGDLLDKISSLLEVNRDELMAEVIVVNGTYANCLSDLYGYKRYDANDLNSYLRVYSGDNLLFSKGLRLFNDLMEVQADGYVLLRHCTLEKGKFQRSDLVVNKRINDIICNFRIDAVDFDNYSDGIDKVLPLAIRECIKEEKVQEVAKVRKKQLVRY